MTTDQHLERVIEALEFSRDVIRSEFEVSGGRIALQGHEIIEQALESAKALRDGMGKPPMVAADSMKTEDSRFMPGEVVFVPESMEWRPIDENDEDLLEALMNEHDMDIPADQFGQYPYSAAHKRGVKAIIRFLNKHGYKKPPLPQSPKGAAR